MTGEPLPTCLVGALLCFALGLAGCKNDDKGAKKEKDPPVPVQVLRIAPSSITRALAYDADVEAELSVRVFSQVPERIVSLRFEEGDAVKQGQLLAIVRRDTLRQGERSATAALDAARADRDYLNGEIARQRKLLRRKIVAQAMVDQLEAKLRAAEAQIRRLEAVARQASTAAGNATIRAPISGVIGRRFLSQGDMAAPSLPLCTVVQMDRVAMQLEVPEQDLAQIGKGMGARIAVRRFPGESFRGEVTRISPTIDQATRTARVKVELENKDHRLMPGMLARVRLEVERKDRVVVLPHKSLIVELGPAGKPLHRVYLVDEGQGQRRRVTGREVKLGIVDGDRVQIASGLSFGQLVVTRGQHLLRDGRRVELVEWLTPEGKVVPAAPKPTPKREERAPGRTGGSPAPGQTGGRGA